METFLKHLCAILLSLVSYSSQSQCDLTIKEIVGFDNLTNSQIETTLLEKRMALIEENIYACTNNSIFSLQIERKDEYPSIDNYSIITSDVSAYVSLKKEVEASKHKYREQIISGETYYTYLYEEYLGICEVTFRSSITNGEWSGLIMISIFK